MQLDLGQVKKLLSLVNGGSNGGGLGALGLLLGGGNQTNQPGQSQPGGGGGLGALGSLLGGGGNNAEGGIKNAMLSSTISKIAQKFSANPSDECLKECTDELNGVFSKFSNVLGDDFNFLKKFL